MNLTSPSQVRAVLSDLGLRPSKALGQNFLIDKNILDILIASAELSATDQVLEVGPGLGVVTEQLLRHAARVVAIEKDKKLRPLLEKLFGDCDRMELIRDDVMDVDLDAILASGVNKVVANLPYSVGSRVLVNLAQSPAAPHLIVVTVQQEVAIKAAAEVDASDYGLLSLWMQVRYDVELVKSVSPTCFWPSPDVKSTILRLRRHDRCPMEAAHLAVFRGLTRLAFMHRRKQFGGILHTELAKTEADQQAIQELLAKEGIHPMARPEDVSPTQWWHLAGTLTAHPWAAALKAHGATASV